MAAHAIVAGVTASHAPRPARQRLSEEERRGQILRAAIQVVAEHGLDGASASLIAERAGVSKGLIWHYFADKTDLMKQAVSTTVLGIARAIAARLDLSAPVPYVIRGAIREAATLSSTHRYEFRAMDQIVRGLRAPDGTPAFSLADYDPLYADQEALLRRGQQEGSLRPFDTRVMAVTYQGAIDAMLGYLDSHPGTDPGRYADALADILLAAMAAR